MMGLVGIAGIAAIVGGGIYIYVTVARCCGAGSSTPVPPADVHADPAQRAHGRRAELRFGRLAAPGTFMLAMVFLVAFILYYFINWKYCRRSGA